MENIISFINLLLTKKLFKLEVKKRIIVISSISFLAMFLNVIEPTYFINDFPYIILIINIMILVLYFYLSMKDIIAVKEIEQKNLQIESLENYNKTLEAMYDDIRAFRHDYGNFIQALNGYAQTNNIEGIKSMTESVLKECTKVNNMRVLDPKIINHAAVYSILANKYYIAQENNISMNIEVLTNIKEIKICDYEFCRILGILLDNAIEAAMECDQKVVNVKFIKDIKISRNLVIIENTYSKVDIDIDRIFDKDYTTKTNNEQNHGLGLYTIRKILNHNKNLNLFTTKSNLFSQQLEIYEK